MTASRRGITDGASNGAGPAKKTKLAASAFASSVPSPEELEPGAIVTYWDGWRGVVRDAFTPLDEFWVFEEESGEIVRDENGDTVVFKSAELQLVAGPPVLAPPAGRKQAGGVLVLGTEPQMMQVLEHFGAPNTFLRHEPQQLLAIPCSMCEPDALLTIVGEGIDDEVRGFACSLRPDIHVAIRTYHLKQAVEQLGADILRMEEYYCLAAVMLPYGLEDVVEVSSDSWEHRWREEIWNQIDVCVTAVGQPTEGDAVASSPTTAAARRALRGCGLAVAEPLWEDALQSALRERLEVKGLPLSFADANGAHIAVVLLPADASCTTTKDGHLLFAEGSAAGPAEEEPAEPQEAAEEEAASEEKPDAPQVQGKTVNQWEEEQSQFKDQPRLPPGWLRIKSRSSGEIYFFNKATKETTFDVPSEPLPEGWIQQVSKSTGKTYYFHAKSKTSTYDRPTQ